MELEDKISSYVWDIFITRSNLLKEISWLKDVYLIDRGDLHSSYYDAVQKLVDSGNPVKSCDLSTEWRKSLDLCELYHLVETFSVKIGKQEIKREFIDAYQERVGTFS